MLCKLPSQALISPKLRLITLAALLLSEAILSVASAATINTNYGLKLTSIHHQYPRKLPQSRIIVSAFSLPPTPSSSNNNIDNKKNEIQYIAGRRILHIQRRIPPSSSLPLKLPLVLIGGAAQTISSWEHHLFALSKYRDVLVYECLGQGPHPPDIQNNYDEYYSDISLSVQVDHLHSVLTQAFPSNGDGVTVDIAGFSLGGRIALAYASTYPNHIQKLHLTGVSASRDAYASLILSCWKDLLQQPPPSQPEDNNNNNTEENDKMALKSFAYSALLATYSNSFLSSKPFEMIHSWVDSIVNTNTRIGILRILEQTHPNDETDAFHNVAMARNIALHGKHVKGQIAIGRNDKMATIDEAKRLQRLLEWGATDDNGMVVYEDCGHAVPIEKAREWRNDLLSFLDSD